MKIPRYWKQVFRHVEDVNFHRNYFKSKKDNSADIHAWGYSDISEADAEIQAENRIEEIVGALSSDVDENFYYPFSVLHEDILEDLSIKGMSQALVTRNRYFSQILNSDNMMFVDIDVPTWDIKPAGFWQRIFGKEKLIIEKNKLEKESRFKKALKLVVQYTEGESNSGFLVYRTFAGFRLIASHKIFDPVSEEVQQVFDALGTDPLYQKLCKVQECFRARLTPKFWRLNKDFGISPSIKFRLTRTMLVDWSDDDEKRVSHFDDWIEKYEREHLNYATCQFVKHVGNQKVAKELMSLIEYHDQLTQAHSGKPLA